MAVTEAELEVLVSKISELNERELIQVLNRAFEVHNTRLESSFRGLRYALVQSIFERGVDSQPYVEFLGVPSESYINYIQDEALESGGCPVCGVVVACVDKLAICPVCGETGVECT